MSSNPYDSSHFRDPLASTPVVAVDLKHSGLGIASFVLSILVGLSIFASLVAAVIAAESGGAEFSDDSGASMILGLAVMGLLLLDLLALALGIGGLLQANRQKVFAILGTLFSFLIAAGTGSLVAIGLAMG